jgi:CRISPR-associated protein Cas2
MSNVIIITYDISNNKVRTKFSKFLEKYGIRIQFSVYEIENSKRIIDIVTQQIKMNFEPKFEPSDSIFIFRTSMKEATKYGSAAHLDNDLIMF